MLEKVVNESGSQETATVESAQYEDLSNKGRNERDGSG